MQAREKDLRRMNMAKLRKLASDLNVSGRGHMRAAELVAAIMAAEAAAGTEEPDEPEESSEPEQVSTSTPDELSEEDYRRIRAADLEGLQAVLEQEGIAEEPALRAAVEREIAEREAKAEAERKRQALQSSVRQFRVAHGGRYIRQGHITEIATGSVVSPLTHDLEDVQAQGIELAPLKKLVVAEDQLGNQVTHVT
jgi:Rho termination factor, N-terminal domain